MFGRPQPGSVGGAVVVVDFESEMPWNDGDGRGAQHHAVTAFAKQRKVEAVVKRMILKFVNRYIDVVRRMDAYGRR